MQTTKDFLEKIREYSLNKKLPAAEDLLFFAKKTSALLQNEDSSYRPKMTLGGGAGALLDFRKKEKLPCIVVPDLHARADFVFNILNFVLPQKIFTQKKSFRVVDALEKNLVRILFTGDLLHAEGRAYKRWLLAQTDFLRGNFSGQAMQQEMCEGLCALIAVMECKCRFPKNFHCLKGNHENIKNETGGGNFAFVKFAMEGEMVLRFMQKVYGKKVLNEINAFEKSLPLAFCTENFFASHAEPAFAMDEDAVINAPLFSDAILALTWTANDEAQKDSVKKMLETFCKKSKNVKPVYIGAHRPVQGKYNLRQDGLYVQIHNPNEQNVAIILPDKTFNPEQDIFSVKNEKTTHIRQHCIKTLRTE